jgi:ubiquinone/menaquinone biosynthesis C-methylase UbiE
MNNTIFPATVMPDADWWHALWPNPDAVIRDIGIMPDISVVDLACGDGYFTAAIARQIQPARVIGFDLDATMLASAQAYCAELANCDWLLGDAMVLSQLITPKMDYVLMANTFHGVPDQAALCQQIAQVLTPTGQFAIINWHNQAREQTPVMDQPRGPRTELRMSVAQTSAVVQSAGFALDRVVDLPPYHYAAIFTLSSRNG